MEDDERNHLLIQQRITSYKRKSTELYEIKPGSLKASLLCIICVALSSCILSMPYTMKTNGVFLCLIICFISYLATLWTQDLLLKVSQKEELYDYKPLCARYYGYKVAYITDLILTIGTLQVIVCYNIMIIGFALNLLEHYDFMNLFPNDPYYRKLVIASALLIIEVIVCSYGKIAQIHTLTKIGTIILLYIIFVEFFNLGIFVRISFLFQKKL
jgi:amino acid permease